MITTTQMYWLTRLDAIVSFGVCLILVSISALIIGFTYIAITTGSPYDSDFKSMFKCLVKWALPFALLGASVCTFVPTTKQMAAILIIPRIANSEKVQQAGNKLYDLAVEWMDELKPNKNNNEGKR